MRRIPGLSVLTLAVLLNGCRDNSPTEVARATAITTRSALVDGAVTPNDGGVLASPVVSVDNGAGDAAAPRISPDGDLACYQVYGQVPAIIRYTRFSSGVVTPIPVPANEFGDFQCAPDGARIAFLRVVHENDEYVNRLLLLDANTSALTEFEQPAGSILAYPAMGGSTVVYSRYTGTGWDERVADIATPAQSQLLNPPGSAMQAAANVSPDGNLVVWERCDIPNGDNCDVQKAVRSGGSWGAPEFVASTGIGFSQVDTDGSYIAYIADLPGAPGWHLYIQSVSGGPVTRLAIPGQQSFPRISGGVVSFGNSDTDPFGPRTLMVYVIASNTLYQVPSSNMTYSDVAVLPNGNVRVVWDGFIAAHSEIFTTTFTPASGFSFGGFLAPLNSPGTVNITKAGAAIPVKFTLGGPRGLDIFANSSPSSAPVTCDAGAPAGPVEETVTAGNSTLTYDAASDTYSYIWKTEKTWANSCRRLTVRFVDGTVATADFQFTK